MITVTFEKTESTRYQVRNAKSMASAKSEIAGSTGGSLSSPRHDTPGTEPIDIASVPPHPLTGKSQRTSSQSLRQGKLTASEKETIRVIADNQSLRKLVAEFGVSHETISTMLRESRRAATG